MPSQAATDTTDGPASASALRGLRAQFKATQAKAKASRPITSPVKRTAKQAAVPEIPARRPHSSSTQTLEARFEEQDRLRQEQRAKRTPPALVQPLAAQTADTTGLMGGKLRAMRIRRRHRLLGPNHQTTAAWALTRGPTAPGHSPDTFRAFYRPSRCNSLVKLRQMRYGALQPTRAVMLEIVPLEPYGAPLSDISGSW